MTPDIITVPETGSTNDDMKELAREGAAEGLWLRAERQTRGRGRQGRSWDSPIGNLYASTLVRLREGDPPAATLALVAGVALWDALADEMGDARGLQLKWPNDVLLEGAKLAGILLEREGEAVIIGCGVNLAHRPDGLDRPAGSLALRIRPPAADMFLQDLASIFARRLAEWRDEGLDPIRGAWLKRAHPDGTPLTIHDGSGDRLTGQFGGLAEDGALRLRLADGEMRVIHAGDVFLI